MIYFFSNFKLKNCNEHILFIFPPLQTVDRDPRKTLGPLKLGTLGLCPCWTYGCYATDTVIWGRRYPLLHRLRGLGERRDLPQWGVERSSSRQTILQH